MIWVVLFILTSVVGVCLGYRNFSRVASAIKLGKPSAVDVPTYMRIKHIVFYALGQKKMFDKPLVAILHLAVYIGFFIVNVELIEILLDGVTGSHRALLSIVSPQVYTILMNIYETFAVLVVISCVIFLVRRTFYPVKRLQHKDLSGFPSVDAKIILGTEIVLMFLFLIMNASEYASIKTHSFFTIHHLPQGVFFASLLSKLLEGNSEFALFSTFKISWWLHYVGILLFVNYIPFSKHLHIILGFANAYYYENAPSGLIKNVPSIQAEVISILQSLPANENTTIDMGAKDVHHLSRTNIRHAFSCTECGRCTNVCPANQTGKMLSPRKIMMAVRDRSEQVIHVPKSETTLLHHFITKEELYACTTCQACIDACPILIDPLQIIIQLRRSLIMEEANAPQEWNEMFANTENNFSPWKYAPHERAKWANEIT